MIKKGKFRDITGDLQLLSRVLARGLVRDIIYWTTLFLVYIILIFLQKHLESWNW